MFFQANRRTDVMASLGLICNSTSPTVGIVTVSTSDIQEFVFDMILSDSEVKRTFACCFVKFNLFAMFLL